MKKRRCSLSFLWLAPLRMACAPDLVVFSQKETVTSNRPSRTSCGRSMRVVACREEHGAGFLAEAVRRGLRAPHGSVVPVAAGVPGIPVERVVGNQPGLFRQRLLLFILRFQPLDGRHLYSPSQGQLHKLPAPFVQGYAEPPAHHLSRPVAGAGVVEAGRLPGAGNGQLPVAVRVGDRAPGVVGAAAGDGAV